MSLPYANLHAHSTYSILRALPHPRDLAQHAKTLGHTASAITDTAHGYGLIAHYQACQKAEIKPILGAEMYVAKDEHYEKRAGIDGQEGIVVLIAKDNAGYQNLVKLLSVASIEGEFQDKPRISLQLIEQYKEGLVCLTGGTRGEIWRLYKGYGEDNARAFYQSLSGIFTDDLYAEIIAVEGQDYSDHNAFIRSISDQIIITTDAHYLTPADQEAAEALNSIRSGASAGTGYATPGVTGHDFPAWEEVTMRVNGISGGEVEAARVRSLDLAEACTVTLDFGQNLLPQFDVPEGETTASTLKKMCQDSIPQHYPEADETLLKTLDERLNYELSIIGKMGFEAYFLIVEDFIRYAKDNGISVGPGRGSAAGSLVAYLLRITSVDPIKYELLFERFLNPERISMPDIDIDFSDERREEVMNYVFEKYGKERVSKVCTFGTLSAKAALKDVGRAYGVDFSLMNRLTKTLPDKPGLTLADAGEVADFKAMMAGDAGLRKVFDIAKKVEGGVRHVSVHACAVIIARDELDRTCPLQWSPTDDTTSITQFPYQQLEDLGLLKMDFLGLKNLSVLEKSLAHIKATTGKEIDLPTIDLEDKAVFEMLADGETTGVFQFESAGMRRYLRELKPTEFEDLVAMNALYRPGPMEYIPQYILGKHDAKTVKYMHPVLEPILRKTYGIAVYQEQVLKIAQVFAGFSLGEADILRKAIGKKIMAVLQTQRKKFIEGAVEKEFKEDLAIKIFDEIIVPFSGYGFNRSHAVCYARIAYETAWCRANHPVCFMAAMMTTDRHNTDRVVLEMHECRHMGIEVLPPDVNQSDAHFTVIKLENGDWGIRFGLTAIKGLGEESAHLIMRERKSGGGFGSISEFVRRIPSKILNRKSLEALTFSGAMDSFGDRGAIASSIDELTTYAKREQEQAQRGQVDLFGGADESMDFTLPSVVATKEDMMTWEKQSLGMYVSDHPMRPYLERIKAEGVLIGTLSNEHIKKPVTLFGLVSGVRKLTTKKGDAMAILTMEDPTGTAEIPVFPRVYEQVNKELLVTDQRIILHGKAEDRDGKINVIANKIERLSATKTDANMDEASQKMTEKVIQPRKSSSQIIPPKHALRS